MEFWPENQGQSSLYSKFGTVPGRNCGHNYHDRHQPSHYPLYYGEQQDQGRESSYWTVPGSRTGGAPQEYTNWTDQELTAQTSSHFPFIIDRHPQQHQDLGEYQPHDGRDREWTAAQRAAREYERGFLREGWQRRWEPCVPVRYNREAPAKRSDSSYRELEAWAARYSHSLPRRRRIEAELRGTSQGLLESSRAPERDSRSGTDPRVAALQQVIQSANIRESGLWDRRGRQQAPTFYPAQTPAADTGHMSQRRMFSQPPGYIAPPPYNSPHKSSPVLHHCDTSWEQEGNRQTYWSQSTLRKQDVPVDLQDPKKGEKEDFKKSDANPYTFPPELEGPTQQRQDMDALQTSSPFSIQKADIQHENTITLQQLQVLQTLQSKKINEQPSSKVIEGRKFRLDKKTGGMTIFCLVSRIADTTETPSLPLCISQTKIQSTELGDISQGLQDSSDINQTHKLADEVDFRAPTLTEKSNTSDATSETPTCVESETHEDNLSNKAETETVSPEKANANDSESSSRKQAAPSGQPVSVKYPLWREPSFTSRAETETSSTYLKAKSEEGEPDVPLQQEETKVHPVDVEVGRLDVKKDTESDDSKGLLVIDTTCVVVKMELIPSPKKEHVHYLDSTLHTEDSPVDIQPAVSPECVPSNSELTQDATADQNAETNPLHLNEKPETEPDSDLVEKQEPEEESEIPCTSTSSVSERETLEERAERILGIPLNDNITEQQPEDATSPQDSSVQDQEVELTSVKDINIGDEDEQIPGDTIEEEASQKQLEVGQTEDAVCSQENDDAKDQVANEGGEDFAAPPEPESSTSNNKDIELGAEIIASPETEMSEDPQLKTPPEDGTNELNQEENQLVENETSSPCVRPSTDLSVSSLLLPSPDTEGPIPALSLMPSSSSLTCLTGDGPDPELTDLNPTDLPDEVSGRDLPPYPETSSLPLTPSKEPPSPLPPKLTDLSPDTILQTDNSPSPSPTDLTDETAEAASSTEDEDKEANTSQPLNKEASEVLEDLESKQFESDRPDAACVEDVSDEQQTTETEKDPTDHIMEETLKISTENDAEVLLHRLECAEEEDVYAKDRSVTSEQLTEEVNEDPTDLNVEETPDISGENATEVNIFQQKLESYITEEQLPNEVHEDPTGLMDQTLSKEILTDDQTQTEVDILQQFDKDEEDDGACLKEGYVTEEQSLREINEDHNGLLEELISKENATDSQTEIEAEILQDTEPQTEPSNSSPPSPSDSRCEASQSILSVLSPSELPSLPDASNESDTEMDLVCPSSLNLIADVGPAAGIPETVPPPLHLGSCEGSLELSCFSPSDSSPVLLPNSSTPFPQEGSGGVSLGLPLKEEPQYPKSLWDAVNRIRKHTAPDSENEEEEVSELWDPESVGGEDSGYPDVVEDTDSERIVFDATGQQEVSTIGSVVDVEVGQIQQDQSGHAEEDTASCSSTSSHGSGDTVIVADEDQVEEMPPDVSTETKIENNEEIQAAEGELMLSAEAQDETVDNGDHDEDESATNESGQREELPAEEASTKTKAEDVLKTEQKEKEEEIFMTSEVSDEEKNESGSVKSENE